MIIGGATSVRSSSTTPAAVREADGVVELQECSHNSNVLPWEKDEREAKRRKKG